MNRIFASVLVATVGLAIADVSTAATADAKTAYHAARSVATANYKVARAKCDTLVDNPKEVCIAEAKATRQHAKNDAKAQYKHSLSARMHARKKNAEADYSVAKAKCDGLSGNDKNVCMKEAKAVKVAVIADATA